MSLVAEYKAKKKAQQLDPIREGIALHEKALADLKIQEKKLDAAYNKRGFELTMAKRAELDIDNVHGRAEIVAEDGSKIPAMDLVIIEPEKDRDMRRLGEDLIFTQAEISRISRKLETLRSYLKTQEAQLI